MFSLASPGFTLSPAMLATAFPFHLVLDRELTVVQAGEVLQRICAGPLLGNPLEQHLRIVRPRLSATFEALQKHSKSLFILEVLHRDMQLKGQIMSAEAEDVLFFLGSPWLTDLSSLKPLGIKLKDFAIHDPMVDFVFLLQVNNASLKETKKLTEELTQQQTQLKQALAVKEKLAQIAEAQAQRLEQALQDLRSTQAQLIQSEKMSGLGQMVAGVAHEINNPVSFIYGNLEHVKTYVSDLLGLVERYRQEGTTEAELADYIDRIDLDFLVEDLPKTIHSMQIGTERIREIVTSLRTFSRLDEADRKTVNLHDGIDSTLLILKHRLKATESRPEIRVVTDYGEIPEAECYAGQLNQVFMNLLSNAIDAIDESPNCKSPLSVRAFNQITIATYLDQQNQLVVKIHDDGPGIPAEIQQRLFDPFFTTKPTGKGTGLGLSISYQIIVEKHGGSLRCESHPGEGTAFYIELPPSLAVR